MSRSTSKPTPDQRTDIAQSELHFQSHYVYGFGGRPVIYEKTNDAKKYLDKSEWWRIVNYDLSNSKSIIDWTHEREWRIPGNFEFDLAKATLLFVNTSVYTKFSSICKKNGTNYLDRVRGIVVMDNLLY